MMLADFLRRAAEYRGPWNCSTTPADWCMALGYPDFAARWRGTTEPDLCEQAPRDAGGLAVLWGEAIGDAMPMVEAPYEAGDIAVVTVAGFEAGAIYTGERWALRKARGLLFARLPESAIVAAWRP